MADNLLVDRRADGTTLLFLRGRLDAETSPQVEVWVDQVLAKRPWRIVFDLTRLEYVSSAGVRIVLKARKLMSERGGQTLLLGPQPSVRRVFDLLHVLRVEEMFDNEADLDAYLDSVQREPEPEPAEGEVAPATGSGSNPNPNSGLA